MMLDKIVLSMASLRIISGSLELCAALLMLRFNDLNKSLLINSSLALVGPLVLISTTAIGLVGLSDKISYSKMLWITAGVGCLMIGILKK